MFLPGPGHADHQDRVSWAPPKHVKKAQASWEIRKKIEENQIVHLSYFQAQVQILLPVENLTNGPSAHWTPHEVRNHAEPPRTALLAFTSRCMAMPGGFPVRMSPEAEPEPAKRMGKLQGTGFSI